MRRVSIALVAAVTLLVASGVAAAAWVVTSSGNGYSKALSMPTGSTPTVSVSGVNVAVSWSASTIGGAAVDGYTIKRYDTSNNLQTIGASCTGLVTGTSCTESSVSAGRWKYTATPKLANWVGGESSYSSQAHVVGAPSSVSCSNCYTNPRTSNKYIYSTNATSVSVQVGLPSTSETGDTVHVTLTDGTNTVTPSTQSGTSGSGTVTFSGISASTLSAGAVTINAWVTEGGSTSATTSTSVTKDIVAPTMTDVQAANAGTLGTPENGDSLTFTFSEQIEPYSILANWSGSSTTLSATLTNSTTAGCLDNLTMAGVTAISKVCFQTNNTTANITYSTSTLLQTGTTVKLTLGGGSTSSRAGGNASMTVNIVAGMTDLAGNGVAATTVTESGAGDKDL